MRKQRRQETQPELVVRALLGELGLSWLANQRGIAGSPDLLNPSARWVVFVHGCFWHQHPGCPRATIPAANRDWWLGKFAGNRERDRRKIEALEAEGWRVVVVWECETRDVERLRARLAGELVPGPEG